MMLERFTDEARRSIVSAKREAARLGHERVKPEHLLMGMLLDASPPAGSVFTSASVSASEIEALPQMRPGGHLVSSVPNMPLDNATLSLLDRAEGEALDLGSSETSTGHVLLAFFHLPDLPASRWLAGRIDVERVQPTLTSALSGRKLPGEPPPLSGAGSGVLAPYKGRLSLAAKRAFTRASQEAARARGAAMTPGLLTRALVWEDCFAIQSLRDSRVDIDKLRQEFPELPPIEPNRVKVTFAPEIPKLLVSADQEATKDGGTYIGTDHLLAVIAMLKRNPTARTLKDVGVRGDVLLQQVEQRRVDLDSLRSRPENRSDLLLEAARAEYRGNVGELRRVWLATIPGAAEDEPSAVAMHRFGLVRACYASGRGDEAAFWLGNPNRAMADLEPARGFPQLALVVAMNGTDEVRRGDLAAAGKHFDNAYALLNSYPEQTVRFLTDLRKAEWMRTYGDAGGAFELIRETLNRARNMSKAVTTESVLSLADHERAVGKLEAAVGLTDEVLGDTRSLPSALLRARVIKARTRAFNDAEGVADELEELVTIVQDYEQPSLEIEVRLGIALAHRNLSSFVRAVNEARIAREKAQELGWKTYAVAALHSEALIAHAQGDGDAAARLRDQTLTEADEIGLKNALLTGTL